MLLPKHFQWLLFVASARDDATAAAASCVHHTMASMANAMSVSDSSGTRKLPANVAQKEEWPCHWQVPHVADATATLHPSTVASDAFVVVVVVENCVVLFGV